MVTLAALHTLGTLDGAFAGFRAMAGRCALVHRRRVGVLAMLWGAAWAQVVLVGTELAGLFLTQISATPATSLLPAGQAALVVYGTYAAVVGLAYVARAIPSVDLQAATSLALFGPLTLARPLSIVSGAVAAGVVDPRPLTIVLAGLVVVAALGLGRALLASGGRWRR